MFVALAVVACDRAEQKPPVVEPKSAAPPVTDAAPEPRAAETQAATCPPLVVVVRKESVWIRDADKQGVIAACGGEIDRAAVQLRLCTVASSLPSHCTAIEVAADTGVAYRQLIDVMDAAITAGFPDVAVTDPPSLSLQLREPADPSDAVTAGCGAPVAPCPPRPAGGAAPAASGPLLGDRTGVEDAVVITVPADGSVLVNGKSVASAREAKTGDRIEPLHRALRDRAALGANRAAILQVDRSVDSRLLNRIIATAKAAGYDQLMFAVKRK